MPSTPLPGHLAVPDAGTGRAILVLHPWWGLNEVMKGFCDRLAGEGFLAFAPDLYHGRRAGTAAEAEILAGGLFEDLERPRADVAEAIAFLHRRAGAPERGLAVIGFSLGAFFALDASVADPERIRAVVVFYGTRPGEYGSSKAVYLGHFAETDEFESASDVRELEDALRRAGRPATFHHYPDTGHWFFESDRPTAYRLQAANLAWGRTLAFLREFFGPGEGERQAEGA